MSRRGLVEGLETPSPLGLMLPGLYLDDSFTQRLLAGLDEVLAPVLGALDSLSAYFDPRLAPADFVAWLGTWVGLVVDEAWPLERRRALVAEAAELYRWRGTARGLRALVALHAGVEPEVEESGGTTWSAAPGAALPGRAEPALVVRVRVPEGAAVDFGRLDALVAAAKPAHVPHRLEVVPA